MIVRMAVGTMCGICYVLCVTMCIHASVCVRAFLCMYVFHLRKLVNERARVLLRVIVMTTMPCNDHYSLLSQ
jgi:hypothetical protein